MPKAKVLAMCQGGNSRSVALAYLLKYKYGLDALACSWECNTEETIAMLCDWAELVFVLQAEFAKFIPETFHAKLRIVDVGPDVWFNGLHPELVAKCDELLKKVSQEAVHA